MLLEDPSQLTLSKSSKTKLETKRLILRKERIKGKQKKVDLSKQRSINNNKVALWFHWLPKELIYTIKVFKAVRRGEAMGNRSVA